MVPWFLTATHVPNQLRFITQHRLTLKVVPSRWETSLAVHPSYTELGEKQDL